MKNIFTQIFIVLGVIFLLLLMFLIYLFVADPYHIKPVIFGNVPTSNQNKETTDGSIKTSNENDATTSASGGFQLSEEQRQAIISIGIDPSSVPSSISVDQEVCFVGILGESRVAEIKAGAVPSTLEFLKAKSCI